MGLASNIDLNGIMEQPKQHTGSFKFGPQVDIENIAPVNQVIKEQKNILPGDNEQFTEPVNKIEDDYFTIKRKK